MFTDMTSTQARPRPGATLCRAAIKTILFAIPATFAAAPLHAQAQTDIVQPTDWQWRASTSVATLAGIVANDYRMVDIEPITGTFTTSYGGAFVRNTGVYNKA